MQVVVSGPTESLDVSAFTVGGTTFDDLTLSGTPSWSAPPNEYARFVTGTPDNSQFGGDDDGFVDMAIPEGTFLSLMGLDYNEPFRVGLSTSATHEVINKDLPLNLVGSDLVADGLSDPIAAVPEPGTTSLALLSLGFLAYARRRFKARKRSGVKEDTQA